ncbi:hypothetical protein [Candidatus Neptunichlamydia sp. REUL1]|uniref:hypothetical protein n=1 Tax=Candidatus Neptunichlamydia sp. REUL1 TaxID=3064277 RepID=UPI0029318060|nr:hypothetical protein [Candidatus Neptunochlamydia sp. REUL1]
MDIVNPVSKPRAALDFMNDWQSALLVGGCVTYLAGRVVLPLLGKSPENHPYLSKMNAKFITFWTFADFAKVSSSIFVGVSDVMTLAERQKKNQEIREGERENQEVREGQRDAEDRRWVHRPNAEMTLNGERYRWVAYRSFATLLKMFSAYVLVHEGLKSVGALKTGPSSMVKAYGATAGLVSLGIDLYDIQLRKNDYKTNNLYESLRKDVAINKADFDSAYLGDLTYRQAAKVITMSVKVMALLSTLSKAELGGLGGRVMKNPYMGKVLENSNDIFNGLFIALTGVLFAQKVHVGANKDKWMADDGTWLLKHVLKSFSDSREFVRLVEGTATTLIDLGYDILAETDLGALGKFAKSFDSFLCVPKVSERTGGLIDKSAKVITDFNMRNVWKAGFAVIKLFADTFAALKFIGAFGGVAYLSGRVKGLGYLKSGFSFIGAIMTISEEVFFPEVHSRTGRNKNSLTQRTLIVLASTGSLFLNGMGGLATAFGDKVTVPGVNKNFKPWVYNFAKVSSTALVAINKFITAPAA